MGEQEEEALAGEKWVRLYPVYLNAKKTIAQGRRLGLRDACDNPTIAEIRDCCEYLQLQYNVEDKAYPRDFMQRGRIRVLLERDGQPVKPDIPNRHALWKRIAELVPKHHGRKKALDQGASSSSVGASTSAAAAAGGGNKKGNKKRRK